MKRREILKGGIGLLAISATGRVLGARPCPPVISGSAAGACPGSPESAQWTWDVPSLQDERDFYENVIGWSYRSSGLQSLSPSFGYGNIHQDAEADDLWTWDQQNKRYATATEQSWRDGWLAWNKSSLISALNANDGDGAPSGHGYDHMCGQGLAVVYHDTGDATILPVFDSLKTIIKGRSLYQSVAAGTPSAMAYYESRGPARWTIVAAYIAQATGDAEWIAIRDNLLDGWMNSTDWEEGGVIAAGGNYFASRAQSGYVFGGAGTAAHDTGRRFHSSFQIGLHVEALYRGYLVTSRTDIRERLIKIAQYVRYYAHEPAWIYPNVGTRFGHQGDGSRWHINGGDGTQTNAAKDCSYDLSLVNSQVIGYKLTGDSTYLDFARTLFKRGIRFDQGSPWPQYSPEGVIPWFIDRFGVGGNTFAFNKGALQYMYLLLENGGNPSQLT